MTHPPPDPFTLSTTRASSAGVAWRLWSNQGWVESSRAVGRSAGSYRRQEATKDLAAEVYLVPRRRGGVDRSMRRRSSLGRTSASYGRCRTHLRTSTPSDQMSTSVPYARCLRISGGSASGVPTTELRLLLAAVSCAANPKSVNFTTPFREHRTFCILMSR